MWHLLEIIMGSAGLLFFFFPSNQGNLIASAVTSVTLVNSWTTEEHELLKSVKFLWSFWGLFTSLELELWIINSSANAFPLLHSPVQQVALSSFLSSLDSRVHCFRAILLMLHTSLSLGPFVEFTGRNCNPRWIQLSPLGCWTVLMTVAQLGILEVLGSLVISLLSASPVYAPTFCINYFRPSLQISRFLFFFTFSRCSCLLLIFYRENRISRAELTQLLAVRFADLHAPAPIVSFFLV